MLQSHNGGNGVIQRDPKIRPMLLRWTPDEKRVIENAARKGVQPRVPESTYVKACALLFSRSLEDEEGLKLLSALASHVMRKYRTKESTGDIIRVFGT